ncbi:hypothetical protein X947_5162 [Burkholderia pseudomallei MSHR7334]|nr:hypothetical protein X947_5162 [Burkholderia pseudomallei MSHR7334]
MPPDGWPTKAGRPESKAPAPASDSTDSTDSTSRELAAWCGTLCARSCAASASSFSTGVSEPSRYAESAACTSVAPGAKSRSRALSSAGGLAGSRIV